MKIKNLTYQDRYGLITPSLPQKNIPNFLKGHMCVIGKWGCSVALVSILTLIQSHKVNSLGHLMLILSALSLLSTKPIYIFLIC